MTAISRNANSRLSQARSCATSTAAVALGMCMLYLVPGRLNFPDLTVNKLAATVSATDLLDITPDRSVNIAPPNLMTLDIIPPGPDDTAGITRVSAAWPNASLTCSTTVQSSLPDLFRSTTRSSFQPGLLDSCSTGHSFICPLLQPGVAAADAIVAKRPGCTLPATVDPRPAAAAAVGDAAAWNRR